MVRYIKDGAYTIIIEDNPSSPDGKDGEQKDGSHPGSPQNKSKPGSSHGPREEDGTDDAIDFTSSEFMLQNLSLATPTFDDDKSNLLRGRFDVAKHIMYQIAFYVYCALQPYSNNVEVPTILVMGDGYIGSKVITFLAEHGCTPILRIYSRGEIGAKEWKQRGFQAHSNLQTLMKDTKPNIIILCSEYSSFHMLYHQLSEQNMLANNACIITSTLGFQRKKLYFNFSIPTIFRTYVEPQRQVASYRSNVQKAIMEMLMNEARDAGMDPRPQQPHSKTTTNPQQLVESTLKEDISVITEAHDEDSVDSHTEMSSSASLSKAAMGLGFDDEDDQDDEKDKQNEIQKAASIMGERNNGIHSMLGLFENYYALHDISFAESRRMALRSIVGYIGTRQTPGSNGRSSSRGKSRQSNKRGQVPVKHVEKICISLLTNVVKTFQEEFSKILPIMELNSLVEEVVKVEAEENDSRELYIDPAGKHHFLKRIVPIHRIYSAVEITGFMSVDDDYSRQQGTAFDFMRAIDERDNRRGSLTSNNSGLMMMKKTTTDQESVHSHESSMGSFGLGMSKGL